MTGYIAPPNNACTCNLEDENMFGETARQSFGFLCMNVLIRSVCFPFKYELVPNMVVFLRDIA